MKLPDLTKEQKQYVLLGVLVSVALIIVIVFGIKVSLSSISEARMELQELRGKIESAEKSVTRSQLANEEFLSTIEELQTHLADIPPDRNFYSWATEVIYSVARSIHFEIDAIDEISKPSADSDTTKPDSVMMESYSLRITARGGYENIKQFLHRIASDHPLVRVIGIDISTGSEPDIHDVQLFIEWPFNLGYIMETWTSIKEQPEKTGPRTADPTSADSPRQDAGPEPDVSEAKKAPVPPAPRPGRETDGPMRSDHPVQEN